MYKSQQNCNYICFKRPKYRILFKEIITFLGLVYRDAMLMTLYLIVIGISIVKAT